MTARSTALRQDLDDTTDELTRMIQETRRSIDQRSLPDTCDASEIIRERLHFWGVLAAEQGRVVSTQLPTEPLHVQLAQAVLTEITDILLDNVFTHSPEGTDLTITLETAQAGHVLLTVANDHQPGSLRAGSGMGHKIIAQRLQKSNGSIHTSQTESTFTAQARMRLA